MGDRGVQKNFPRTLAAHLAGLPKTKRVEIWFQDEARLGQKNGRVRIWAKKGTRPRLPADQRYTNAYLFGAICPVGAKGAALMLPFANTAAMQMHLDEISCNVAAKAHGVVLMDRAGWHSTDQLKVPKINALRGHCAEFGLIVAQGASKVEELVAIIEDPGNVRLPPLAREALGSLVEQLRSAQARIKQLEVTLLAWHRSNEASRRLATIPGVGVITATALVATIGDGAQFRSGRQLSAWLGLVPRQHSSGGKDRLGRISKRGDGYIGRLLVHGARTVLRWRRAKPGTGPGWTDRLLARRPTNVVLVAMANKTARVAWALLRYERIYRPTPA